MADIKRLLKKKGWTGRELGNTGAFQYGYYVPASLKGKEPQPIVEQARFREMINGITDRQQGANL